MVMEERDAGFELVRAFSRYRPVDVAFWLKGADDDRRYLHIASGRVRDEALTEAYTEILRLTQTAELRGVDPFRVKLVNADDPLATAALDFQRRYTEHLMMQVNLGTFGGLNVDELCVYPKPDPVAIP
jgi:hypothetical protein